MRTPEECKRIPMPQGTPIVLGDGQTWMFPTLPLGKRGQALAKQIADWERLLGDSGLREGVVSKMELMVELSDKLLDIVLGVLGVNYNVVKEDLEDFIQWGHSGQIMAAITGSDQGLGMIRKEARPKPDPTVPPAQPAPAATAAPPA